MVAVIRAERRSTVLTPSSLACLSRIPTINLTAGCSIGCAYCYTLGYSSNPGDGKVVLYENTLEKLKAELARKRIKPRAVFFSPSSDLFQPVPEVLALGHQVLEFLLSKGIGVAFLTKGEIPEGTMSLLLGHAENVRAEVGIITVDENIARVFESEAANPRVRLEQIARLIRGGVPTEARIDPVLPSITDAPHVLRRLFRSLAKAGVKRVAVSTLFLRPAILDSLKRNLPDKNALQILLGAYAVSGRLAIRAEHSSVIALPRERRQAIFEGVKHAAREHRIEVSICACKNPDLARGTCGISGRWSRQRQGSIQRSLFDMGE